MVIPRMKEIGRKGEEQAGCGHGRIKLGKAWPAYYLTLRLDFNFKDSPIFFFDSSRRRFFDARFTS